MGSQISRRRQLTRYALSIAMGFIGATYVFTSTKLGPELLGIQVKLDEPISPIRIEETGRPGHWSVTLLPGDVVPSIHIQGQGQTFMYLGAMMRVDLYTRDGKLIGKDLQGQIDTGSDMTYVVQSVMDKANLTPLTTHTTFAGEASKTIQSKFYQATVNFINGQKLPLVVGTFPQGQTRYDILIGRDVLSQGVLVYNGLKGWATLSFGRADPPVWPSPDFNPRQ